MQDFISLYDDQKYKQSFLSSLCSLKQKTSGESIVYLIKNIITQNKFKVVSQDRLKKLVLYYFYTHGEVRFTNNYIIYFKKELLRLDFFTLANIHNYKDLRNFKQYFDLGKNEVFLNKIFDTTTDDNKKNLRDNYVEISTITDFFIAFLHENFELYSLESEHFPLFKWLIGELSTEEEDHYHTNPT